jgi:uncharacterized protein (DUF1684 family)
MKMKRFALLPVILLLTFSSFAQPDYYVYQSTYKKDLYDIIQSDTAFVRFYPVNSEYKVTASVQKLPGQKFFSLPASDGKSKQAIKYALITFKLMGKDYQLYAYQLSTLLNSEDYKDNFFIPFTDLSSGKTSYGGGRYIDFVTSDISPDGSLVIDFNKAYNPYCAFREGYSCPIPPSENDLPVEIMAGEMTFNKK